MSTSVRLPRKLLERVDRRAQELGVSRNLFIRRAIERGLEAEASWSPALLKLLGDAASNFEGANAVDEMMNGIASRRTRK
jgi:predicted transcriptional regulator